MVSAQTLSHVTSIPSSRAQGSGRLGVRVHFPGDPTFVRTHLFDTLHSFKQSCEALLSRSRDPQTQLQLLKGCFTACRFTFLLRLAPICFVRDILTLFYDPPLRPLLAPLLRTPTSSRSRCPSQKGALGWAMVQVLGWNRELDTARY